MIDYKLAKELKEAGFPNMEMISTKAGGEPVSVSWCMPTLSKLIEACGESQVYVSLIQHKGTNVNWDSWEAQFDNAEISGEAYGSTSEEAVARLWLELNK